MGTRNNIIRIAYQARQSRFAALAKDGKIVIDNMFYATGYIPLKQCFVPTYDEYYKQYVVYAESYYRGGHVTILYHEAGE